MTDHKNTKSHFDTKYVHTIICPYCGYKYPDPLEEAPGEEDIGELVCPRCEQDFYATRDISITYSTEMIGTG